MINLPSWLNKGDIEKLASVATQHWKNLNNYILWAVSQRDELQNEEPVLGLIAHERQVKKLPNESDELYRNRVRHALVNTIDAGQFNTIKDIFDRLDIEVLRVRERLAGRDWDIVAIDFTESSMATYSDILSTLVQMYGRTCRRYEFTVHNTAKLALSAVCIDHQFDQHTVQHDAVLTASNTAIRAHTFAFIDHQFDQHTVQHDAVLTASNTFEMTTTVCTLDVIYGYSFATMGDNMENTINGYIPNSGRNHINKCMVNNRPFGIKKLLFANIPGVNQNTPRADDMSIPPTLQIVHEMNYTQVGYLDENTVAWTFALTPDDGDFTYNTLLLVSVDEEDKDYDNVLIAFDHIPLQHKVAGVASHHNRSFVIKTEAAAARNNITIPAQSWMFDQTPQINALQAQVATLASMQFRTQLQLLKQNIG